MSATTQKNKAAAEKAKWHRSEPVVLGDGFDEPGEFSRVAIVFGAEALAHMPAYDQIPENFRRWGGDSESAPWLDFQSAWFHSGTSKDRVRPRDGIDEFRAWGHLRMIQGSFEPKHEHKVAAVAWLASRWFAAVSS